MQLPHFLLIDLDDTILDLSTSSNLAWKSISLIFAPKLSIDSEKLLLALTRSRDWYWSDTHRSQLGRKNLANAHYQIVNNAFQDLGLYNRHISGEIAEKYSILREKLITPIKGAEETLQIFYNQHIKMGLITNGSSKIQRSRINRFGLNRYFECLLIEEEFDILLEPEEISEMLNYKDIVRVVKLKLSHTDQL